MNWRKRALRRTLLSNVFAGDAAEHRDYSVRAGGLGQSLWCSALFKVGSVGCLYPRTQFPAGMRCGVALLGIVGRRKFHELVRP